MHPPASNTATLCDLRPGESASISGLESGVSFRVRLLELGFVPGGRLKVIRRAPLGCPVEVEISGSHYCLRREQAKAVWVERAS